MSASTAMSASLFDTARREAETHKWIESQKHGCDLGDHAIREWYRTYWLLYCRHRRLEHIRGETRWMEFETETFGVRYTLIMTHGLLADRILDRLDLGYENLDVIAWSQEWDLPMLRVLDILEAIDVNRARIDHPAAM
ncbi:hypothetical protein [Stratiformator vulcanicus]|uniref:Uncharacterized protein n=1 Tax=Stratiformator vulcanicus TaxID=2527980 RepID=A0A517QZS1_9PLAN|nr:hypothetical protein [Stratiformator vulcanicus]QDT37093.1 hypothetical protein Pan189_14610 [Stratiformator vulcanicus]